MQILSDVIELPFSDLNNIETVLSEKYGEIVRCAIVEASGDKIKVSFSYKK